MTPRRPVTTRPAAVYRTTCTDYRYAVPLSPIMIAETSALADWWKRRAAGLPGAHGKREQRVACANHDVLCPVELIADRTVAHPGAKVGMPQRFARGGVH